MKKRKNHKTKPKKNFSYDFGKHIVTTLLFLSFSLIIISASVFTMVFLEDKNQEKALIAESEKKIDTLMDKMNKIIKQKPKEEIPLESDDYEYAQKIIEQEKLKESKKTKETTKQEKIKEPVKKDIKPIKKETVSKTKDKPKLAIIIDDVSSYAEIKKIKKIKLEITPSIFPPTTNFPSTPKFARDLDFYMIHLPLEAMNFYSPQEKTLTTKSTQIEISGRIKQIRILFPNATMVNNHTGSKFTADKNAMIKLMYALKKYDFEFLDSKTIAKTKAQVVAKLVNKKVLERDIFLDNVIEVKAIQKQLKKAIEIAKKNGQAIAIGHPKDETIEAILRSHNMLKEVEVVYANKLL